MLSTPSMRPRIEEVAMSVVQALKAASLAVEPKKVMTESAMITITTASPLILM